MSVSQGSASGDLTTPRELPAEVLISGLNWLGDSVMSMPALQEFKRRNPGRKITMLAKSWLVPLWRMHPAVDAIVELRQGIAGTVATAKELRAGGYESAYVLPNSFRSALVPYLAGVPGRIGMPGHARSWMLTRSVLPPVTEGRRHQSFEYLHVMGLDDIDDAGTPELVVDDNVLAGCRSGLAEGLAGYGERKLIGFMPGASYGPAKRWPTARFAEVARSLVEEHECLVVVLGSLAEQSICAEVAAAAGASGINMAGKTSLSQLAGNLSLCDVVVSNDSGGMHLASAMGRRVISVFGLTDASKTGPIGEGHRVIVAEGVTGARDLARDSEDARRALESIDAAEVIKTALEVLQGVK